METELALRWGGWVGGRAGEKVREEAQDTAQSASQPTSNQSTVHTLQCVCCDVCSQDGQSGVKSEPVIKTCFHPLKKIQASGQGHPHIFPSI